MAQNDERRVLNFTGARQLTAQECEHVSGAFIIRTGLCQITVLPDGSCTWKGDCEPPPAC